MTAPFSELADEVQARFREAGYRLDAFSAVAAKALRERPLHRELDVWEFMEGEMFGDGAELRPKDMNSVGNTLVVHRTPLLNITLTFSFDTILALHHHSWAGAFQVLEGASITRECRFEAEEWVDPSFAVGRFQGGRLRVLRPGDTVEVLDGPKFIHGVSHLARPSVALTVRRRVASDEATHNYWQPGVSVQTLVTDPSVRSQIARARMLRAVNQLDAHAAFLASVGRSRDPRAVFWVAEAELLAGVDEAVLAPLLESFDEDSPGAAKIRAAIAERRRQRDLRSIRATEFGARHRESLAALAYADESDDAESLRRELQLPSWETFWCEARAEGHEPDGWARFSGPMRRAS